MILADRNIPDSYREGLRARQKTKCSRIPLPETNQVVAECVSISS